LEATSEAVNRPMHVALGYRWFPTAAGYHLERAFAAIGADVHFIGVSDHGRAGHGETTSLLRIFEAMDTPPDFFLWIDPAGRYFPLDIEASPIPTACYLIDVHLGKWRFEVARFFDVVFVAQKDYVEPLRTRLGHQQVYWLPLAAADDVHFDHQVARVYEVGFVGNLARAHEKTSRRRRLQRLHKHFTMNDWSRSYTPAEVGAVYSRSKIVFNTSIAGDVTMRIFEGAACGALVLTDAVRNGLEELYRPGEEIVIFVDDDDLLEKVRYYLAHEAEREAIARAGQARTLAQHTYRHRAQSILEVMRAADLRQNAPMRAASTAERSAVRRKIYTHLHMLDAIFDLEKAGGAHPLLKLWRALPCLARRILR